MAGKQGCIGKEEFRVQSSGFRFQDSGFRVQGSGFRFQGVQRFLAHKDPPPGTTAGLSVGSYCRVPGEDGSLKCVAARARQRRPRSFCRSFILSSLWTPKDYGPTS